MIFLKEIELCLTIELDKHEEKIIRGQQLSDEAIRILQKNTCMNVNQSYPIQENHVIIPVNSGLNNENIYLH